MATLSDTSGYLVSTPVNGIQIVPVGADPDFSMAVLPMSETVTLATTAYIVGNVEALNGFTGVVHLSLSPDGAPVGGTESVFPFSVKGSGSAIITIHTTANSNSGREYSRSAGRAALYLCGRFLDDISCGSGFRADRAGL